MDKGDGQIKRDELSERPIGLAAAQVSGTTFIVRGHPRGPDLVEQPAEITRPRGTILAVDDDPAVLGMLTGFLSHLHYVCGTASSGAQALRCIERTDFDLVITDLQMPGMEGDELAQEIKRRKPELPVLLVTGSLRQNFPTAVDSVLHKPFSLGELKEAIATAALSVRHRADGC